MADFLEEKRREINGRLKELKPAVDEFNRLEEAAAALNHAVGSSGGGEARQPSTPGARKASGGGARSNQGGGVPRGRPRGSGARAKQALELVRAHPGITINELAERMGIKANYLYRVMPGLAAGGQVVKRAGGWHADDRAAKPQAPSTNGEQPTRSGGKRGGGGRRRRARSN